MAVVALVPLFSWIGSSLGTAAVTSGVVTGASVGGAAAIGSAIGTVVAGVAGSYIDQMWMRPLLTPNQDSKGPRLDDLPIQTGSEGSGMHYCLGAENRIAGTVIWISDLIEEKRETSVEGGKGGGGGAKQTTYNYYLDVAIGVCEGPVAGIDKIWADSKLIYDAQGGLRVGGDATGYTVNSFQPQGDENINVTAGTGSFMVGDYVQFGGTGPLYRVEQPLTGTGTLRIESPGIQYDIHTGDSVTLMSLGTDGVKDPRAHLIRVYLGDESQTPDSIIEAAMGAGNVPAFRGTCYVVIDGLLLRDWGNRLPQFTFLVRAQNHESCAAGISNILERAQINYSLGQYNVDAVAHSIRGYSLTGPTTSIAAIEPIMQAYDILVQESNSSLVFFQRGAETVIDVDADDVACGEKGQRGVVPFRLTDPSGFDLPREVNVTYQDPTNDWQKGSQRHIRNDQPTIQVLNIDLPLVMHPSDAANVAANRLWRGYAERAQVEGTLPPSYFHVEENDIIRVPYQGELYSIRISDVTIGNNYLIAYKGLLTGSEPADEAITCSKRINKATPVQPIVQALPVLLDTVALTDDDAGTPGVYAAISANSLEGTFNGAAVYVSSDGQNFSAANALPMPATMGYTTNALADGVTEGYWDYANTVDVEMIEGTLQSVSEARLLAGANRAWLGKELIAYQNATLIGPRKYRLSSILRGLRATSMKNHVAGDRLIFISPDSTHFVPVSGSAVGQYRYFKFLQQGQSLAQVGTWSIQVTGGSMRQLPPVVDATSHDATSHDVTVTWFRRTRFNTPLFSAYKPMGADSEKYEVDFAASSTGAVLRTKTVTSPTVTYTGAEQTADGLPSGAAVYVRIYQINEQVGRGYPAEVNVP
jgi:hypothetical protein